MILDDDLRTLYQEVILDHGKRPRNFRPMVEANKEALGDNPLCGDKINVHVRVSPSHVIEDISFEGKGCAISQASASLMTETVKGKKEKEVQDLFKAFHALCTQDRPPIAETKINTEAIERLQVLSGVRQFPTRVKCATLAWHTLMAALAGEEKVSTEKP